MYKNTNLIASTMLALCLATPITCLAAEANPIHRTAFANVDNNKPLFVLAQHGVLHNNHCNILRDELVVIESFKQKHFDVSPGHYANSPNNPYDCITLKFSQGSTSAIDADIKLIKNTKGIITGTIPAYRLVAFK